jgi:DNA-binding response OmpR family regulator
LDTLAQGTRDPVRVLLVLDQPVLAEVIKLALNHGAFLTRVSETAAGATAALHEWAPQFAVVDMDIAQGAVLDQLGYRAPQTGRLPVMGLTRRGDIKTKLEAFDRGLDDILTVPFSPEELVARTLAIMRRVYPGAGMFQPVIQLGELKIDILSRSVRIGGHELHLTPLEQCLLYLLAANTGRILTRGEILDHLWGTDYAAESNVVDRHIRDLRAKLQNNWRRPRYIATVPGQGYRFVPMSSARV